MSTCNVSCGTRQHEKPCQYSHFPECCCYRFSFFEALCWQIYHVKMGHMPADTGIVHACPFWKPSGMLGRPALAYAGS